MATAQRLARLSFFPIVVALALASAHAAPSESVILDIDLSGPFSTQSMWRLTAFQGPTIDVVDDGAMPGDVRLCLHRDASSPCDPQLQSRLEPGESLDSQPHYLNKPQIFQEESGQPILFVQTAGYPGADGDQVVFSQVLAYRRGSDDFVRVYDHMTGRNNNQEVRFIDRGALKGKIIWVEPTDNAPFGYWVSVNAAASDGMYKEILRFRSATTYGDGNRLAVIDSEMPNIQKRLGLWRPGAPLPLPARGCAKPRLIKMALWCD